MAPISPDDLRDAVATASRAPSIHNTQPWRWAIRADALSLRLDRRRQLAATDPDGHSALISCGAALRLAQLALAAQGWTATVDYLPDPADPDHVATLGVTRHASADPDAAALVELAQRRVSDRRLLDARAVPDGVWERLRRCAPGPEVFVRLVRPGDETLALAVATSQATDRAAHDPAEQGELRDWARAGDTAVDGVPHRAAPRVVGGERHSDVPQRELAAPGQPGGLPVPGGVDEHPRFAVVVTDGDGAADRLRAGAAAMQLMLEAARLGLASCPVSQAVDHASGRGQLSHALGGVGTAQLVIRLGVPMSPGTLAPTARRPVEDILDTTVDA